MEILRQYFPPQPPRTVGVTDAERKLQRLCDKTFLTLWSHAGLYTDEGKKGSEGDGKELCDLLVVFENHVIIFSDKDCAFPSTGNLTLDWSRWFRRAVLRSAKQIWGAESWIKRFPSRIFIDRKCQRPFPVPLPRPAESVVHRIVVAHGVTERFRQECYGSGSLMIVPSIVGSAHYEAGPDRVYPFTIGQLDPSEGYVHVLDDTSLSILMNERDTISDFIAYLTKKEKLIESGKLNYAAGEEELIAYYLKNLNTKGEHDFTFPAKYDSVTIEEGLWEEFAASPQHTDKRKADSVSYVCDELIEKFTHHFLNGTAPRCSHPNFADQERLFRALAKATRLERRIIATEFGETLNKGNTTDRFIRVGRPLGSDGPYYVFLTLKNSTEQYSDYAEYRELRHKMLEAACLIVKATFPSAEDIIGIATDPLRGPEDERSEDAVFLDAREWSAEMQAYALDLQRDTQILTDTSEYRKDYKEYPFRHSMPPDLPSHSLGRKENRKLLNQRCGCGSGKKLKNCCMR